MGGLDDLKIDGEALQSKLDKNVLIAGILSDSNFKSADDILKTYAGRAADLQPWMKNAQINHDNNLRLAYLAGKALNNDDATLILNHILAYRKYPGEILKATPTQRAFLEQTWNLPGPPAPGTDRP